MKSDIDWTNNESEKLTLKIKELENKNDNLYK